MSKNAGIPQHFKDAFPNLPGNPVFESQAWLKNDLISCLLSPSGEDSNEIISFLEQHLPQPSRQVDYVNEVIAKLEAELTITGLPTHT